MSQLITVVTSASFEEIVLKSEFPVLVDFWAEWCGPCLALAPRLEQVATQYESTCKVVKLNIDEHPDIAKQYNVRSIPTLILFKNGQIQGTKVGLLSEEALIQFITESI